jgi:hypothetical protein
LTSGEINIDNSGTIQIGNGGVYSAMAADETKPVVDETINSIISVLNLGIGVLTFLVTPLIMLAGWLLSPDWTFGEIFGLRPILHQLWILISNVVYVIFGFMLVFVAFANIFGWEHSKAYEMKTMLPKLVTGMLMVPFTWFIVSAVLSISNVLTASVISLPMETILKSGGSTSKLLDTPIIPKLIVYNKWIDNGTGSTDWENWLTNNGEFVASNCPEAGTAGCISVKDFLTGGGWGAYNLLSVYAYGIFKIQWYKAITPEQKINKTWDIASKLWFWVIFFVIFGILVIAIVYALFSRAIMLWLFAMFSPLFALMYVMGKSEKFKALEHFSVTKFISLAMVPVYVSAALAFGLMFLGLVMWATGNEEKTGNGKLTSGVVDINSLNGNTTIFKFWAEKNGITLITNGLLDSEAKSWVSSALDIGKGIIGTIIMNVLALVILWMAVMAALGSDEITKAAVSPISEMWDSVWKLMKSAPSYVPIPGTGGQSVKSVTQWVSGIKWWIETAASSKASDITRKFWFEDAANRNQAYAKLNAATTNWQVKPAIDALREMEKTYTDINAALNDWKFREAVAKLGKMKEIGVEINPESINSPKWLADAYRQIDNTLEHKGIGDLVHGAKDMAITETVVAWRFGKHSVDAVGKDVGGLKSLSESDVKEMNDESKKKNVHYQITINGKNLDLDDKRNFTKIENEVEDLKAIFKNTASTSEELKKKIEDTFKDIGNGDILARAVIEKIWSNSDILIKK